jgi:hypothetical protein
MRLMPDFPAATLSRLFAKLRTVSFAPEKISD